MNTLPAELESPYQGYVYSYPHKTAYRALQPIRRLASVWRDEPRTNRFLYVHVPFCEMRCGFCNLFTLANPADSMEQAFLNALSREAETAARETRTETLAQLAIGGGTPTFLSAADLSRLFNLLDRCFAISDVPVAIETSPKTATADRLNVLRDRNIQRISIGVQSLVEDETRAMGRPQDPAEVVQALDRIRQFGFPELNVDLIYGAAGQTLESWAFSIARVLIWAPEEIYLYPLYVRPRTGLDGRLEVWDQHRLSLYRAGRDQLLAAGYRQVSMRHFRRQDAAVSHAREYSCQEDGMIGLGPGARSYTSHFHYSTAFAVSRKAVLAALDEYVHHTDFEHVRYGIDLDRNEQERRYVLKSLLRSEGMDRIRFRALFDRDAIEAVPALQRLVDCGLLNLSHTRIVPTAAGLERSDAVGPWLYAPTITDRMQAFETT